MAREIAVTFALGATLKGGYKAAFQSAATQARNVAGALRAMEKTPVGKLGSAMQAQREKIKGLSGSLKEARQSLATLNAQAAGGGSAMLGRQIELATSRVKSLEGALNRQLGAWRNTTAQAATASGGVSRLARDYEKLSQKMERARKVSQGLHANRARAEALRAERADLNSRLTGAVATAATVAVPMKLSVDFEDSIARVGAVANASDEDMARLTATARQLGRDTVFSASQAAEGMQYLSMAGFDADETIAAMPGMLDLAAAGNTDLGRTADIASDILSAFKLKAGDMGQVSDTLAKSFTTSNTTLEMLGDTMKYVGPVAASVGLSLQDTSAMAGMLGNVGIKASQAGTVMRGALLRLAAPRKMARDTLGQLAGVEGEELDQLAGELDGADEALKELGMTTKDEAGNLRPMVDILEELNARTAKMGGGDKAEVFAKIFGTEASAGMMALAEQAAVTVDKYGKQITNSLGQPTNALRAYMEQVNDYEGTGARIAKRMNETTGGALRRLKSAWEDVGISVGNLFLPAISGVADGLSAVGNVISGAVERFPVLSRVIGVTAAALGALLVGSVGFGLVSNTVKTGLNGLRGAFLRVAAGQALTTAATTVAGGAFSLAGAASRFFAGGLRSILMATGVGAALVGIGYVLALLVDNWDEVKEAAGKCWAAVTGWAGDFFDCVAGICKDMTEIFDGVVAGAKAIFGPFFDWLREHFSWVFSAFDAVGSAVSSVTGTIGRAWDKVFGEEKEDAREKAIRKFGSAEKAAWAYSGEGQRVQFRVGLAVHDGIALGAKMAAEAAQPKFKPVSASAVNAASAPVAGKATGKAASGAAKGRRAGSGAGSASGSASGAGPVTVVTLGGDDQAPQTLFFPAGGSAAMPAAAAAQASRAAQVPRALPQAPDLAKAAPRGPGKGSETAPGSVTVDLTQHFDLIAGDARAVRKVLESIRPDMEALVRRALEKLQSDRRRTAYAQ